MKPVTCCDYIFMNTFDKTLKTETFVTVVFLRIHKFRYCTDSRNFLDTTKSFMICVSDDVKNVLCGFYKVGWNMIIVIISFYLFIYQYQCISQANIQILLEEVYQNSSRPFDRTL